MFGRFREMFGRFGRRMLGEVCWDTIFKISVLSWVSFSNYLGFFGGKQPITIYVFSFMFY